MYWNKVINNGLANIASPKAAGRAIKQTNRIDQSKVSENFSDDPWVCFSDKLGNTAVAKAMPNTPKGNSTRRSEKYNHEMLPVFRNEAIKVSINKFICTMETANNIGTINLMIGLTPSLSLVNDGFGNFFIFSKKGAWKNNWIKPAISTAHANASTGVSSNGANQTAQIIKDKFNKTGVKAGIAKFL